MKLVKLLHMICLGTLVLLNLSLEAQVITVSVNSWSEDVDANDLSTPSEAGTDLSPTLETASSFNKIDIFNVAKTQGWKVAVSRQDVNWPAALSISLRRTSTGTPCAGCIGVNTMISPAAYIPLTLIETDFIYGSGEVTDINVQVMVDGLSLTLDADSYSTEIIYTLYGD